VAGAAVADDVTYRGQIAPLWQSKCIACHGAQSPERADFLLDEKGYAAKSQGPLAAWQRTASDKWFAATDTKPK
jgi:mono/diheme cytochrome c family protein